MSRKERVYIGVLAALLVVLFLGALTFERAEWPTLIGDESTYLMAAQSLAWDGDLGYERQDYDRFVELWKVKPEGLILQSGDAGGHITFGKPFFYPLFIAPFVRLAPIRGPFVANALLLSLAAFMATRTLRRSVGRVAPLWVSAFLFASVTFAYTFWVHADLFLLSLTAIALSLAFREDEPSTGRLALRWATVGLLLALVVFSRPLYVPLFLPAVLAVPRGRWVRAVAALALGALLATGTASLVHRINADAWTSYGAQRRGFYDATGYPEVDFPAADWQQSLGDLGDAAWVEAGKLPPSALSLWLWNGLYFAIGRFVGVLPYFLPLVLGLLGRPRRPQHWALLIAVAVSIAGFFLYRPFNFYGGGGAIANRYFLPLYPAFWFLASRPVRPPRMLLVWAVAVPFMWPLWAAPRAYPQRQNHTYRYVSSVAARILPYETTQSHLKPAGRSDVVLNGLWFKLLSPSLRVKRDGTALLLDRGSRGQLLVGSYAALQELELRTLDGPAETIRVVKGAEVVEEEVGDDGRRLALELRRLRARHPMWWTWDDFYLYQLTLESDSDGEGRQTFTIGQAVGRGEARN